MRNKLNVVIQHIKNSGIDICFLQETFLKSHDGAYLQEIREQGYKVHSVSRSDGREHGGLAVVYSPDIKLKPQRLSKSNKLYKTLEYFESTLMTNIGLVRIINMYRPTYSSSHRYTIKHFLVEFEQFLEALVMKPGYLVLVGDFNIHVENNDTNTSAFNNLLKQSNLDLIVSTELSTHISGGTLDLIVSSHDIVNKFENIEVFPYGTQSDHFLVSCEVDCTVNVMDNDKQRTYRNYKSLNIEHFRDDLKSSKLLQIDLSKASLDDLVNCYNDELSELMNKHCPLLEVKHHHRNKDVWFDDELQNLRSKCRARERKWHKSKLPSDKDEYKEAYKLYDSTLKQKRQLHHSKSLTSSKDNKRQLFSKINTLLGKESVILPANDDDMKTANEFSNYFNSKVYTIRDEIASKLLSRDNVTNETVCSTCVYNGTPFSTFSHITIEDLKTLLKAMNNKFCDLDPIPTWLLLECFSELGNILLHIVNKSLLSGTFPSSLKTAIVNPIIKEFSSDRDSVKNYRPVSNLAFLSKLIEKAASFQLDDHLLKNELYGNNQSGYRKFHSCETSNINMYNNIMKDMDNGNVVVLLLLDMSSAFDTVDHYLLLNALKNCFGLDGNVYKWFASYLEDRTYRVKIGNAFSDFICALFGVPQGSILGPILFILYTRHLEHIALRHGLSIKLYADDSQLYISFNPSKDDCTMFCDKVNACLVDIKLWVERKFLKLNEGKTKLIILSKPSVTMNESILLSVDDKNIAEVDWELEKDIKSLGVYIDPRLDMNKHISYIRQFCIGQLSSWKHIATLLDTDTRLMLVKQIILSKLDYNNSLLCGLPGYVIKSLQFIINCAMRFVYNVRYREHITPYIIRSHILPVKYRIEYKICLTVFKCLHDLAPQYLQELLKWNTPTNDVLNIYDDSNFVPRTTQDPYLLIVPSDFGKRTRYRSRTFSHYAPRSWNTLPYALRCCNDKSVFKTKLKTHFFNVFLSDCAE